MYMQGKNGGLGEINFSSIVKDVTAAYATIEQAKAAKKIAEINAQNALATQTSPFFPTQYTGSYSPMYSPAPQTSNIMPLILLGGAALALILLMRK